MARVVVAGLVVAGTPLALAGTANAAPAATADVAPAALVNTAPDTVWDNIAQCESGGKWNTSTGNGYSGGLQFSPHTWRAYGGKGSASGASREEQISVAQKVLAAQGWGAWPSCSRKTGVRGSSSHSSSSSSTSSSSHRSTSGGLRTTASRITHQKFKSSDDDN